MTLLKTIVLLGFLNIAYSLAADYKVHHIYHVISTIASLCADTISFVC